MNCPNCGYELKEKVCPVCQTTVEVTTNDRYEEYKENEQLNEKYGFNKLLIFSIIELICCAQVFGLVGILFLFLKLKPAISERNFEEADKWEHNIKLILIIGLVLGLFSGIAQVLIEVVPMLMAL